MRVAAPTSSLLRSSGLSSSAANAANMSDDSNSSRRSRRSPRLRSRTTGVTPSAFRVRAIVATSSVASRIASGLNSSCTPLAASVTVNVPRSTLTLVTSPGPSGVCTHVPRLGISAFISTYCSCSYAKQQSKRPQTPLILAGLRGKSWSLAILIETRA